MFLFWGAFVEPESRLNVAVLNNRGRKKGVGNRKQNREKEVEEK